MSTKTCIITGLINLLFCGVLWLFLIPFLIGNEYEHTRSKRYVIDMPQIYMHQTVPNFNLNNFNPLQKFLDLVFSKIEEQLVEGQGEQGNKEYVKSVKIYFPSIFSCAMVMSIIYAVSCVLMIIGSCSYGCLRGLMLPYLFLQMVFNIVISTYTIMLHVAMLMMSKHTTGATIVLILSYLYAYIISFQNMARVMRHWIFNIFCAGVYLFINIWTLLFSLGNLLYNIHCCCLLTRFFSPFSWLFPQTSKKIRDNLCSTGCLSAK